MGFQTNVYKELAVAIPGEIFRNDPYVAETKIVGSASVTIGTVVTQSTVADTLCVQGGEGVFLGIVANPKEYSNFTDFGVSFSVAQNSQVDILNSGTIAVVTSTDVDIKNKALKIYYENATGIIGQAADVPADHTEIPNARFINNSVAADGIAILHIEG